MLEYRASFALLFAGRVLSLIGGPNRRRAWICGDYRGTVCFLERQLNFILTGIWNEGSPIVTRKERTRKRTIYDLDFVKLAIRIGNRYAAITILATGT